MFRFGEPTYLYLLLLLPFLELSTCIPITKEGRIFAVLVILLCWLN